MFKKGEVKFGITVFGLPGPITRNIKEGLRKLANEGYSFIEFWPSEWWWMLDLPDDKVHKSRKEIVKRVKKTFPTKAKFFEHYRQVLTWMKEYNLTPVIDFGGYWRQIWGFVECRKVEAWFKELYYETRLVFPKHNFIIKLFNEPYVGSPPKDFVLRALHKGKYIYSYNHVKAWANTRNVYYNVEPDQILWDSQRQSVRRWGWFHRHIADILEELRFPIENILVDVNDLPKCEDVNNERPCWTKDLSLADMVLGKMGDIGNRMHKIFSSWHQYHFPEDFPGRINRALRTWKYFISNDGKSRTKRKGHGYMTGCPPRSIYQSTNAEELETALEYICLKVKGSRHKITIWHSDLLRDIFAYDKNCNLTFDFNNIDWDRLGKAPEVHKRVFGKYPKNHDKFPEPTPTPKPKPKPKPEPKPKPKPKEEKMNAWKLLVPKFRTPVVVDFKGFWKHANTEQKIVSIVGASIVVCVLGLWIF